MADGRTHGSCHCRDGTELEGTVLSEGSDTPRAGTSGDGVWRGDSAQGARRGVTTNGQGPPFRLGSGTGVVMRHCKHI